MAGRRRRKRKKQKKFTVNKKAVLISAAALLILLLIAIAVFMAGGRKPEEKSDPATVVNRPEKDAAGDPAEQQDAEADWYNLPGYINGADKNGEQVICGVTLPYRVENTPLVIEGIGQYTGPFVEDGSDEPAANVLAVVVKNESDTDVEYAEIKFSAGEGGEADFHISTLPAGKSVVALEQNKREFNPEDVLTFLDRLYADGNMDVMEDKVEVTAVNGALTLKNLTEEELGTVYVRYKNKLTDNYYLGGITYSCRFENVGPGDSTESETKHFSADGSTVLMVEAIEE